MSIQGFNDMANGVLAPVFDNPYLSGLIKLSLVMFGSLAAPKIAPKYGYLFANTGFRILIMFLIIWTFNHDPALSVIIAVSYFMVMEHVLKNAVKEVSSTGIVTPAIASILSGGASSTSGNATTQATVANLQNAVNASKAAGFLTSIPQAVTASGPPSIGSDANVSTRPSGVPATATTMFAEGSGDIEPYMSNDVASLAEAPK